MSNFDEEDMKLLREITSESNSELKSKPNPNSISDENENQNQNENQNEILNQFLNQFRNKFGIDSVKKVANFAEKYPQLFYGILGGIVMQYLSENPGISEDIFKRFLEIMESEL